MCILEGKNVMKKLFSLILGLPLLLSCSENHFITDPNYRDRVEQDFQQKQEIMSQGDLFSVLRLPLTVEEKEALMFLYAYMPIGDVTDYSGEYYLNNIRSSFYARKEMPWGKRIPEDIFRHFVLPVRVNNENLDDSRWIFYNELRNRVINLSLYDAVLEVNHWCHEKVIYAPSDERTSSPLASVKTAYGRCGEESTFLVAALRSVGIPARQVYTPRWAHTDDNHAWVEAWVDGKWHFLGACEPEPVLDLAWFNAPASRGMLMHTKVFGRYTGPEEVMSITPNYTEINIIGNYAETAKVQITVCDTAGQPLSDARVEFKVYNYGEFYTVADKRTDANGTVSLTAGKGDMLVWASKGGLFGYEKVSLQKDSVKTIVLRKEPKDFSGLSLNIVPPEEAVLAVEVSPEQREINNKRLAYEDSVRTAYVSTFLSRQEAIKFAREVGVDSTKAVEILLKSRGNHTGITSFLSSVPDKKREDAMLLLEVISDKDLRDTPADVLHDCLKHTFPCRDSLMRDFWAQYVLNPRISNELLSKYKGNFLKKLDKSFIRQVREDPSKWVSWCRNYIKIEDSLNIQRIPVVPSGVWSSRRADTHSRDIFCVAVLRSCGVPARIDAVTGKTQYFSDSTWVDVNFESGAGMFSPQGSLRLNFTPSKQIANPQYYTHFTLSKLVDGRLQLLTFPEGEAGSWNVAFKEPVSLDTGIYLLVSGTRMASGSVLSRLSFFEIKEGETTTVDLVMRENNKDVQVIGSFNSEAGFTALTGEEETPATVLNTTGRGYFVVGILGVNQEPTNHALRDIAAVAADFDAWGRKMILLFPSRDQMQKFKQSDFPGLPKNIVYGIDDDGSVQRMIVENMKLTGKENLPLFLIADTFNRVVYFSQGYTIGLGEQLMNVVRKL